jgi:CRISPR-associated endonuclease Csn1
MKKILGLDIGTTSIGWAIVEATDEKKENEKTNEVAATDINNDRIGIHKDAVGVRIISQDAANMQSFNKGEKLIQGSTLTPTANRRVKRGSRRVKSRYKLRRGKLNDVLTKGLKIVRDEKYYTNERKNDVNGNRIKRGDNNDIGKAIYELRDRAIREKISLSELGRILLHLNQWRGYSSDRFKSTEKEETTAGITAKVINIEKSEDFVSNKIIKKKETITIYNTFIIEFDNGDKAIEIRSKENEKSDFLLNELYTYSFNDNEEVNGLKQITKKKLNETSWAFKKEKINTSIQKWWNTGGTLGSYFYHNFYELKNIERIRNNTIDRDWYEREFDKIWDLQFEYHKDFFEKINIDDTVNDAFPKIYKNGKGNAAYLQILHEVRKKEGIKEQLKYLLKDKIIFFQRPWQQAKNKGQCPFEKIKVKKEQTVKGTGKKETIEMYIGRTVIPRSHPLFQEFKIWQQINNVRVYLTNVYPKIDLFSDESAFKKYIGKEISEVKQLLYRALQNSKTLAWKNFAEKELELKNKEIVDEETGETINGKFEFNFRKLKRDRITWEDIKLKGNTTKVSLQNILNDKTNDWFYETHSSKQQISNLQLLWEIIYDITNSDAKKVAEILKKHFGFDKELCLQLAKIKFDDTGMGNLSAKAIRHILPMMCNGNNLTEKAKKKIDSLISLNRSEEENAKDKDEKLEGLRNFITDKKARLRLSKFGNQNAFTYLNYWEATAVMFGSHSSKNTSTKPEISRVENHSMNNPVVEKIVNETISIVNEIYKTYGFDEVRIELSRELKASMDERRQMWEAMTNNAEKNEWAKQMLRELKSNSNLDVETSNKSNIDKIKIIEDVVKHKLPNEYKLKIKELKLDEPTKAEVKKYLMWLEQNFRCPYTDQPIPLTDVFARGKIVEIEHIIPRERYYLNSYANKVITWREVNQVKADNGNRTAYEFIVSKRVQETVKVGDKEFSLVSKEKWEEHIKTMFPKGGKRTNLLRKEIPEEPINRTLNETQYINKKLKEKLAELVGEQKVWVTSGAVTDILRDRFEKFNIGESKEKLNLAHWTKQYNSKTNNYEDVEVFEGFSKRLDHRHHALDAIIIACTKQNHIQYINTLNAINNSDQLNTEDKKRKYASLKKEICIGDSSKKFFTPWNKDNFIVDVKKTLSELLVAHKNTRLLISPSKHRANKNIKPNKIASIRGELHKETNYAKKNYFTNEQTPINKLIPQLLKVKTENQNQIMVFPKSFETIIKETVLKEKYQNILIPLFSKYNEEKLNNSLCKEISKSILKEIETNKLLLNSETNQPLEWLSTYSDKDKSNRPNGLAMDLNKEKEIKDIADPRIKRLAEYRLDYVNKKCAEIEKLDLDKKEKDKKKSEIKSTPLYSNAIYELRIKREDYDERIKAKLNPCRWVELKDFDKKDFDKIEYAKKEITQRIKTKLKDVDFNELKLSYFTNPIFISNTPILVKKVRQMSYYQKSLYEITPKRYVQVEDTFMTYFFIDRNQTDGNPKREIIFLKFLDAARIITEKKPSQIDYKRLIEKEKSDEEIQKGIKYDLLFTLSKNDLVYLPENSLTQEQQKEINWDDKQAILPFLYIVKDMNPSLNKITFQQIYKADAIQISEADAKSLFKNPELKAQKEEIKYGIAEMMQNCIKVFTSKLGKKVVPYWEFPNGCWNKEKARELGLIHDGKAAPQINLNLDGGKEGIGSNSSLSE